jgi:hypothetical protein
MGFLLLLQPLKFQSIISNWLARHKAQDIGRHGAGMGQAWGRGAALPGPWPGSWPGYWVGIRLSNDLANDLARERRQDGAKCLKGLALEAVPHGSSRRPPLACQGGGFSSSLRPSQRAPVAQLDRAPDYESGGWEFESLRAHHILNE